jgi:hypothetical protein
MAVGRRLALFAGIGITLLLAGCAWNKEPDVLFERREAIATPRVERLLLVFDLRLELQNRETAGGPPQPALESPFREVYTPYAMAIEDALRRQGLTVAHQIHLAKGPLPRPDASYSHVWVVQLTKMRQAGYNAFTSTDRFWSATILQRADAVGARWVPAYRTTYQSDGPSCRLEPTAARVEACTATHVDLVVKQWGRYRESP